MRYKGGYIGTKKHLKTYLGAKLVADYSTVTPPVSNDPTTLRAAGFPLGFMIKKDTLNNANNRNTIIAEAVSLTPENNFKDTVKSFDPVTGNYTTSYTNTDPQVIWAKANGKKVHVHNGLWLGKEPQWIKDLEPNPAMTVQKWWDLLKILMQTPLLHHKNDPALDGVIESYDAINEPFRESADMNTSKQTFKDSVFIRKLGVGCIKQAVKWAKEADPRIKVFINDYGFEYGGYKVDAMIKFANECKTESVPLDGWGLQYHQTCQISSTATSATRKNLKLLADTVNHIHLSEVALKLNYLPYFVSGQPFVYTQEMATLQAQKYRALLQYFVLDIPKSKQFGFKPWGIIDADYLGSGVQEYAMLFNDTYQRKLAYDYMLAEQIRINKL